MKAIVIGSGYVGLVTGACLADVGVEVCCIDIDKSKIEGLNQGIVPIYEPGLEGLILKNKQTKRLSFSTSLAKNIENAQAVFIAVGTPPDEDGSADMTYVMNAAREVGRHINEYTVIITKSTVPIGSSEMVRAAVQQSLSERGKDLPFDIVSNPEFLKEGAAIKDFMSPDRIIVGCDNDRSKEIMDTLYKPFLLNGYRILYMDLPSAEMSKYAANAMLATRISFMNDIANLCEIVGANINQVRAGISADPRIGKKFLYAGTGYGGSCFPKDVKALIKIGRENNNTLRLLEAVEAINQDQKLKLLEKITAHFKGTIQGLTVGIWGLAFKPNTNDIREAPAVTLIEQLLKAGATINIFDPVAMKEGQQIFGNKVNWCHDSYTAIKGAHGVALVTEWNEFRLPNWEQMKSLMRMPVIFDGRNIYDRKLVEKSGFTYYGIGQ